MLTISTISITTLRCTCTATRGLLFYKTLFLLQLRIGLTCMLSFNQALPMTYCRSCEAHRLARLVALTEFEKSFWSTCKNWTTNTMVARLWTAFL